MQIVMDPDREWRDIIEAQLQWVDRWIVPDLEGIYKGPNGRIKLLQLLIDSKLISKSETVKLRCLGTYFGQAIVEITGWPWKVVEDKDGIDLAIHVPDREDWLFPITMISKRIENDEHVDVRELFDSVVPLIYRVGSDKSDGSNPIQ